MSPIVHARTLSHTNAFSVYHVPLLDVRGHGYPQLPFCVHFQQYLFLCYFFLCSASYSCHMCFTSDHSSIYLALSMTPEKYWKVGLKGDLLATNCRSAPYMMSVASSTCETYDWERYINTEPREEKEQSLSGITHKSIRSKFGWGLGGRAHKLPDSPVD